MRQNQAPAVLAILGTTIFWGLSFSSTKVLLNDLVPEQIAFFRLVLAVLALGLVFWATRQKTVAKSDLWRMAAGGAAGVFLYFLFENNGLRFTTAGTASLIVSITPALNAVAGALFFKEHHPLSRWFGVLLSIFGVYMIINSGSAGSLALANLGGNLLIFLAGCTWVAYTRINVPLLQKYNSLTVNFFQSLAGMILLGSLALPRGLDISTFTPTVAMNLAYLGLFCSAAAYFLYLYALKNLGSTTATTFLNLVPVFGVLGGALLLKETLSGGQLIGAAIVVLGVTLVTSAYNRSEVTENSPLSPSSSRRNSGNPLPVLDEMETRLPFDEKKWFQ
ncbi:MAG: DMT family transporter [Bacillota bacterium]